MPTVTPISLPKIALLGGDLRQLAAADALRAAGYPVALWGFDTYAEGISLPREEVLQGASLLLLPVPVLRCDRLNLPFSAQRLEPDALADELLAHRDTLRLVAGGKIPPSLTETLTCGGVEVRDLTDTETFNLRNAIPTAEGAIAIAMQHLDVTLHGASVCVTGFGRIGRILCRLLASLGAHVTAVARSSRDMALAEVEGYRPATYGDLPTLGPTFDAVFNTVPTTVLTESVLAALKPEALIVDLASKPGGVDHEAALRQNRRVVTALSLPGKVAPVTAGRIIADCLMELHREVTV